MNVRTARGTAVSEREAVRREIKGEKKGRRLDWERVTQSGASFMIFPLNNALWPFAEEGEEWVVWEAAYTADWKHEQVLGLPEPNFLYCYVKHQEVFKGDFVTCKFRASFRWSRIQTDKSTRLLRYVDNRGEQCVLHFTGSQIIMNIIS